MTDFTRALGNPTLGRRVRKIWVSLVEYTRTQYPIYPVQNFTAGQALPNGAILLDVAIAGNESVDVTAFWMAHEWAHQYGDHVRDLFALGFMGRYQAMIANRSHEDSADRWAARFLWDNGYDVEPVLEFLESIPEVPGDTHSNGEQRAKNVAAAFEKAGDLDGVNMEIQGNWKGVLQIPGGQLQLALRVQGEDENLRGTFYDKTQSRVGVPVDFIIYEDEILKFSVSSINAAFEGTYYNGAIDGAFTQRGAKLPLKLFKD